MTDETTHKHSHPCNPPGGTMWDPGPCTICGISFDLANAEAELAKAQAAVAAATGSAS